MISLLPSLYKNNKIRRDAWHLIFFFRRASASLLNAVVTDRIDPCPIRIYCHVNEIQYNAWLLCELKAIQVALPLNDCATSLLEIYYILFKILEKSLKMAA